MKQDQEYQKELKVYMQSLDEDELELLKSSKKVKKEKAKVSKKTLFPDKPKKLGIGPYMLFQRQNEEKIENEVDKVMKKEHGKKWRDKKVHPQVFKIRAGIVKVNLLKF